MWGFACCVCVLGYCVYSLEEKKNWKNVCMNKYTGKLSWQFSVFVWWPFCTFFTVQLLVLVVETHYLRYNFTANSAGWVTHSGLEVCSDLESLILAIEIVMLVLRVCDWYRVTEIRREKKRDDWNDTHTSAERFLSDPD